MLGGGGGGGKPSRRGPSLFRWRLLPTQPLCPPRAFLTPPGNSLQLLEACNAWTYTDPATQKQFSAHCYTWPGGNMLE